MSDDEDSAEMISAKSLTLKGTVIVLVGATIVLALGIVTVTDPVKYMTEYTMQWWIVAGIGAAITFIGMGITTVGQNRQQHILNKEISELLAKIVEKQQAKQE